MVSAFVDVDTERRLVTALVRHPKRIDDAPVANLKAAMGDDGLGPFWDASAASAFRCLVGLHAAGAVVDESLVRAGVPNLAMADWPVGESGNVAAYIDSVTDNHRRRSMVATATQLTIGAHAADVHPVLENASTALATIQSGQSLESVPSMHDGGALAAATLGWVSRKIDTRFSTGIPDLDKILGGGLQPGRVYTICARPGMGKSAFSMGIAADIASRGLKTVIFSLEMSAAEVGLRLVCRDAGLHYLKMEAGAADLSEASKISATLRSLQNWPLVVDDQPGLSYSQMIARARHILRRPTDRGVVVVDHIGLQGGLDESNTVSKLDASSMALKNLAKELRVPVIIVSQLNRAVEQRPDKRPMMSDLRGSGGLEQNSDAVIALYRDGYYNPTGNTNAESLEIMVLKQRGGPSKTVLAKMNMPSMRIFV